MHCTLPPRTPHHLFSVPPPPYLRSSISRHSSDKINTWYRGQFYWDQFCRCHSEVTGEIYDPVKQLRMDSGSTNYALQLSATTADMKAHTYLAWSSWVEMHNALYIVMIHFTSTLYLSVKPSALSLLWSRISKFSITLSTCGFAKRNHSCLWNQYSMLLHKSPFAVPVVSTGENSKTIKNLCEWHKHSQYTLVALLWSGTAESLSNEKIAV
jgi:hypothetical protein